MTQGVKGLTFRVPGGQRVGQQGLRGSRGRPKGSPGVKGLTYRVPGGQGVCLRCLRGTRGRP